MKSNLFWNSFKLCEHSDNVKSLLQIISGKIISFLQRKHKLIINLNKLYNKSVCEQLIALVITFFDRIECANKVIKLLFNQILKLCKIVLLLVENQFQIDVILGKLSDLQIKIWNVFDVVKADKIQRLRIYM